ncbi:LysR family transcriptional regulator [Xanthobacteraceae bacterium Astr-EGSB]|uniref:LysR family transcriptional regulator n=1 Tax=Astrobacterium formosum TaxID=3069710 RepID=UPI0027B7CA60|nr:LysR family transcriptional regulator [Xanthobacteraceae bacterium Astr-EGSB]
MTHSDDEQLRSTAGSLSPTSLNLTRLRYFVAVAQELHFGRAAARLGISQPPLTTHIQALEHQVGAQLFTRNKRNVSLTVHGRTLLLQATQLLDHAERVVHVMQGLQTGEQGNLFLGCVPFGLFKVLPAITRRLRQQYPGINLVVTEAHTMDVLRGVSEDRLDVGLVWKNLDVSGFGTHTVLQGRFVAALPEGHHLLDRDVLTVKDLAPEPLILPSRKISPFHYDEILALFSRRGVIPRIDYEIPLLLSQLGYVASGFGVAITPDIVKTFVGLGVVYRDIGEPMAPVQLSLVWKDHPQPRSVVQFIDIVKSLHQELDPGAPLPAGT